jgi:hypothetical protein
MFQLISLLLSALGLACTAFGAYKTAKGVVLVKNSHGRIGVARIAPDSPAEWGSSPLPSALRDASDAAEKGLYWIVVGTLVQLGPILAQLLVAI